MSKTSQVEEDGAATPADHTLAPGATLGSYRILDLLGSGGMGNVYFAEHALVGRHVAIKRLHPKFMSDEETVRRFFAEGKLVNQIKHEHIAEITDFVSEGNDAYYVMELLKGRTLKQLIAHEGRLPFRRACHIARQLCSVLGEVHRKKIVHRDLKPDNVFLIERQGDPDFVKLLDFGVARDNTASGKTAVGIAVGTPWYMAPEQFDGSRIDHRCDIYALGVVMFQMVTGQVPFDGETDLKVLVKQATEAPPRPSTLVGRDLPPLFEDLILSCLQKRARDRPTSCRNVAETLSQIEALPDGDPGTPKPGPRTRTPTPLPKSGASLLAFVDDAPAAPPPPRRRRRRLRTLLVVALLVGAGGAATILWGGASVRREVDAWRRRGATLFSSGRSRAEAAWRAAQAEPAKTSPTPMPTPTPTPTQAPTQAAPVPLHEALDAAMPEAVARGLGPPDEVEATANDPSAADERKRSSSRRSKPRSGRRERAEPALDSDAANQAAAIHYERARMHLKEQKTLAAIAELEQSVGADPKFALAHRALAGAYSRLGRREKAIKALETYIALAPSAPDIERVKGLLVEYRAGR